MDSTKRGGRTAPEYNALLVRRLRWSPGVKLVPTRSAAENSLRIAQISPLYESVPPQLYGGTERIVSYLTEELVSLGHEVTLFASGDSRTAARLVTPCAYALRLSGCNDPLPHHYLMLEELRRMAHEFDVLHFHIDYLHFLLSRRERWTQLTTLHGRLDLPDLVPLYREFVDQPLVSISDSQRTPLKWAHWAGTVHHGLPSDLYRLQERPGDYVAFLGRISPEKRVDRAIEIAGRAGAKLKIAAKVDRADAEYFAQIIAPLLRQPHVEFIGEIGDRDKQEFLGGAQALLFPIDWPEPFGLVMIEAMACGTPVIAYRRGSVPEVIDDAATGFICDDVDDAVRALEMVPSLSRARCRRVLDERFTARRMAQDYVEVYARLMQGRFDARDAGRIHDPRHQLAGG